MDLPSLSKYLWISYNFPNSWLEKYSVKIGLLGLSKPFWTSQPLFNKNPSIHTEEAEDKNIYFCIHNSGEGALSNKNTVFTKNPTGVRQIGDSGKSQPKQIYIKEGRTQPATYIQWLRRNFQLGQVCFAAGFELVDAAAVALAAVVFRG